MTYTGPTYNLHRKGDLLRFHKESKIPGYAVYLNLSANRYLSCPTAWTA